MKSSIAIAALVAAALGLSTAAPVFAQGFMNGSPSDEAQIQLRLNDGTPAHPQLFDAHMMMPGHGMMGAGGMMMLVCSPNGAEALDAILLHLSYRLDLTAEQKPLFDAFRAKALTAQTSFADACKADTPAAGATATPDFLARLKARLSLDQARLTALNDVLPSFEALYNSLTDKQKAALTPDDGPDGQFFRDNRDGIGGLFMYWHDRGGMGRMDRPMMPDRG